MTSQYSDSPNAENTPAHRLVSLAYKTLHTCDGVAEHYRYTGTILEVERGPARTLPGIQRDICNCFIAENYWLLAITALPGVYIPAEYNPTTYPRIYRWDLTNLAHVTYWNCPLLPGHWAVAVLGQTKIFAVLFTPK